MRVTFNSQYRDLQAAIDRSSESLIEAQRQVSSGKRVSKPSDDPTAAASGVAGRNDIARLEQYTGAADSVAARLTVVDTALADMVDKLGQARAAAAGASGSQRTATEREGVALTLEGMRDAILNDLNTSFKGIHVFSGTKSSTQPYVLNPDQTGSYQGCADEAEVDIDNGRAVKVTYDGEAIAKGSDANNVLTVFKNLIDDVRSGNPDGIATGIQALQSAFERVAAVETRVGAQMKTIEDQKGRLSELKLLAQTRLQEVENVDLAEAITTMTQAETAYRAALGAAGKTTSMSLMDFVR